MNWGYKIFIVIVAFVVSMLSMVAVAMRQNNEMIDDHYYEKEITYQSQIDAANNLLRLTQNTLVQQTNNQMTILLPLAAAQNVVGKAEFLRLSDQKKDFTQSFNADGSCSIAKKHLMAGVYKVRLKWTSNGTPYYKEESVFIQK